MSCRRRRFSCARSARLLGWRLAMDGVDPRGTVTLTSEGGEFTRYPRGAPATLPSDLHPPRRRQHRLPGQRRVRGDGPPPRHGRPVQPPARTAGTRRLAAGRRDLCALAGDGRHEQPAGCPHVTGVAGRWSRPLRALPARRGVLVAADRSPPRSAAPSTRPGRGSAMSAARSGFRRAASSSQPEWIGQNFQHGTLNFDREKSRVVQVIDGLAYELPPPVAVWSAPAGRAVQRGHGLPDVTATNVPAPAPPRRRYWAP